MKIRNLFWNENVPLKHSLQSLGKGWGGGEMGSNDSDKIISSGRQS